MKKILPVGVLVSGRGSNLQAIIDAINKGNLSAEIKIVISNNADSQAIVRASEHSIPIKILLDKGFSSKSEYDKKLIEILNKNGVDLVVLAGFMR
ncbi:MAG: formyltransferase family protein, partial [Thermodesulfobacteriota bacterium]